MDADDLVDEAPPFAAIVSPMDERRSAPSAVHLLRSSGLDTSGGAEFIQQRIALFARMIAGISLLFLVVGGVLGFTVPATVILHPVEQTTIAHLCGLVLVTLVWLVTRRGRLSLRTLELIDAAAVIGSCTAGAFFVTPQVGVSIFGSVVSVTLIVLARAIVVPSSAGRTLRLSLLSCRSSGRSGCGSAAPALLRAGELEVLAEARVVADVIEVRVRADQPRTVEPVRERLLQPGERFVLVSGERVGAGEIEYLRDQGSHDWDVPSQDRNALTQFTIQVIGVIEKFAKASVAVMSKVMLENPSMPVNVPFGQRTAVPLNLHV
jgi:hypothetical protein